LDSLTKKYEQMLEELRRQAGSDKEFVANELRKKIAELEKQIEDMRADWGSERGEMLEQQKQLIAKAET